MSAELQSEVVDNAIVDETDSQPPGTNKDTTSIKHVHPWISFLGLLGAKDGQLCGKTAALSLLFSLNRRDCGNISSIFDC